MEWKHHHLQACFHRPPEKAHHRKPTQLRRASYEASSHPMIDSGRTGSCAHPGQKAAQSLKVKQRSGMQQNSTQPSRPSKASGVWVGNAMGHVGTRVRTPLDVALLTGGTRVASSAAPSASSRQQKTQSALGSLPGKLWRNASRELAAFRSYLGSPLVNYGCECPRRDVSAPEAHRN